MPFDDLIEVGLIGQENLVPRRFELVVFDIGGVLVRAVRTWVEGHERAGLRVAPPTGPEFEARLAALPRRDTGSVDSEQYFALFAEASQGAYTAADVRRINDASLIGEYPRVERVLDALELTGIETAVLSNTNDAHWARLFAQPREVSEFPTLMRVRYRFASHLMGALKPQPYVYCHVERATGHVADRILFFDDTFANVEGARAVGWTAELIDNTGDPAAQIMASLRRYGVVN